MDKAKQQIVETVDAAREDLLALSKNIHDNPELGFQEFKAMGFISDTLEKHGFTVQRGYGGLHQKGNISISLTPNPRMVIADEPLFWHGFPAHGPR